MFHGESGTEEAEGRETTPLNSLSCRVGDVEQRNLDTRLDVWRDTVHRVRTEHYEVSTGFLKCERGICKKRARLGPLIGVLQALDFRKICAVKEELGGMEAAELFCDGPVDDLVVGDGGLPAHSAEETDRPHASLQLQAPDGLRASCVPQTDRAAGTA